MNLTLPIYVEGSTRVQRTTVYRARPLFFPTPVLQNENLDRLLTRLAQELGKTLTELGRGQRHEQLAAYSFSPKVAQHRLDLVLQLRRHTARCRFLFVLFHQLDRRLAFTPSLPDLWFDVARAETLRDRAVEVLTRHFRDQERDESGANPEALSINGAAFVTPLDLVIRPPGVPPAPQTSRFLFLGDAEPVSGAVELRRVGRCLDWQYPDDLERVVLRNAEVEELTRLLEAKERRPVLLVGMRQAGKTALVHEFVYRRVSRHASPFRDRENVWLLAPQRLIAGMSYVGQWENRLLAILKEVQRREHILYVDDMLGLFQAGQTCHSTLSVAAVLKPYLERRQVRLLGEISPEALRVLRERDRDFADLFHLLPVPPANEIDTLHILINVQRHLEGRHRCRFDLEVIPAIVDLQRRYARDAAFPGKAVTFLQQLAVKFRGEQVTRAAALNELQARTGLSLQFLDNRVRLERAEVLDSLSKQIIGQEHTLNAAADVVAVAKARLNDPERPLAAFLFLGPTGVGKTQCAKALAAYLFGSEERLLRFDLNEFGAPGSAARLVGTFDQPEGLLTRAIRRQPFAVVLFDEVEKASPEVHDLLLQVLGEGRLTDALGRTADFSQALIILTSNLGVREAESRFGFRQDEASVAAVYVQAAERFFRPEFFNRLDRVLPFHRLTHDHVRQIASKLLEEVFRREGVVQRRCMLAVEEQAMEQIVDRGYDPVLGARAMKRAIERQVTQPVAAHLAALPPTGFTTVRIYAGPEQLVVGVQRLKELEALPPRSLPFDQPEELLERIREALQRINEDLSPLRPAEPLASGTILPEHYAYFAVREQLDRIRGRARRLRDKIDTLRTARRRHLAYRRPDVPRGHWLRVVRSYDHPYHLLLRETAAALNLNEYLRELSETAVPLSTAAHAPALQELVNSTAMFQLMAENLRASTVDRVLLWLHDAARSGGAKAIAELYRHELSDLHLNVTECDSAEESGNEANLFMVLQGAAAALVAQLETGSHLFCLERGRLIHVRVIARPLPADRDAADAARAWRAERQAWLDELRQGHGSPADDPLFPGSVVRIYTASVRLIFPPRPGAKPRLIPVPSPGIWDAVVTLDLRTGYTGEGLRLRDCVLAALPLPPELKREN